MAGLDRNDRPESIGIGGRDASEYAKEIGEDVTLRRDGRYIEISVVFMGYKKPAEQGIGGVTLQKGEPLDLILRFVKEVVQRNRGMMRIEADEKKAKTFISLRFPVERRKVVYYQSVN